LLRGRATSTAPWPVRCARRAAGDRDRVEDDGGGNVVGLGAVDQHPVGWAPYR
jgi:hypothetical protein